MTNGLVDNLPSKDTSSTDRSIVWAVINLTTVLAKEHPLTNTKGLADFNAEMPMVVAVLQTLPDIAVVETERMVKMLRGSEPSALTISEAAEHYIRNLEGELQCAQEVYELMVVQTDS